MCLNSLAEIDSEWIFLKHSRILTSNVYIEIAQSDWSMKVKSDWFKKQRLYPFLKITKIRVCWRRENAYISAVFKAFFFILFLKDVSSALKSFCQRSFGYLLWFLRYSRKTVKLQTFLQIVFSDLITLFSDWSRKVFPHTSVFGLVLFVS